jgi:hypothetical protein
LAVRISGKAGRFAAISRAPDWKNIPRSSLPPVVRVGSACRLHPVGRLDTPPFSHCNIGCEDSFIVARPSLRGGFSSNYSWGGTSFGLRSAGGGAPPALRPTCRPDSNLRHASPQNAVGGGSYRPPGSSQRAASSGVLLSVSRSTIRLACRIRATGIAPSNGRNAPVKRASPAWRGETNSKAS